ncbi:hypothetical protein JS528_09125 [Bifidobacterium sp. MA2]|uniref:Uncharacterized protein n=1 Tax=Bifidobacterium santillanense TaxID=2809028 RepID=A0ABS5URS4_9BIFI|nr:hypothetical protein [Bifidobacterium santillanense]MBT1173498.1 hypothetical protein [Bifidobacterium santillanense]
MDAGDYVEFDNYAELELCLKLMGWLTLIGRSEDMRFLRRMIIAFFLVGVFSAGILATICYIYQQMGLSFIQKPVNTSSTDIELSQSRLFSQSVLREGAVHIEKDVSFMRGCSIDRITYSEVLPDDLSRKDVKEKNKTGVQASYMMFYRCDSFNAQTQSMGSSGSYVYRLLYDPSRSSDGTGWITIGFGNG